MQQVLSREARTFHDWTTLVDLLLEMAETDAVEAGAPDGREKQAPDNDMGIYYLCACNLSL